MGFKNPSIESVAGEHTQLYTEGFPIIFHEGLFSSWNHIFLADFMCRCRTRSRMFAFGWLTVAWEWLERTLGALGLRFGSVISWFHGMIWRYDHIILWYDHVILWYDHVIFWYDHAILRYDHEMLMIYMIYADDIVVWHMLMVHADDPCCWHMLMI